MYTTIPIGKLHPHRDNPRKDLGDLTELADSIMASGVLQNLTVVPWFSAITGAPADDPEKQDEMGYTVVIGHRRLAAAKVAGLSELPCIISDMDLRTQVSTMMVENLQRSDLTVYEQAMGFQTMLDFGDTVADVAMRTGFSETTVRRRVSLLDLDKEKFRASVERGASLSDYIELGKIKDAALKNDVLEKIGTDNFKYALLQAVNAEQQEERAAAWRKALGAFAAEVEDYSYSDYRSVKNYSVSDEIPDSVCPEDAGEKDYSFNISKYGSVRLMLKTCDIEMPEENPEAAKQKDELERRVSGLEDAEARSYELRREFMGGISAPHAKKRLAEIVTFITMSLHGYWGFKGKDMMVLLAAEPSEDGGYSKEAIEAAIAKSPERALAAMAYGFTGDAENNSYSRWNAGYSENEKLDGFYGFLSKLGYGMSDEEKRLMDGTHELYLSGCDLCKSSHIWCSGCCSACGDKCNSRQKCRKPNEEAEDLD